MAKSSQRHASIPQSHHDILESQCYPIACTIRPDGLISANPVSILWEQGQIRFTTLKDRMKIRNLQADPRLTLCAIHPHNPLHYLEVRGHAVLEDDADRAFVNRIAMKYMGLEAFPYDPPGAERMIVTVVAEQVSTPFMGKLAR